MRIRSLLAAAVVLSFVVAGCSGDSSGTPFPTPGPTDATETTNATRGTPAPTDAPTTIAQVTTTTAAETTTTAAATTTTAAETTTTAVDVVTIDPDGIGEAKLGDEPESVITYFNSLFGPPTSDSGWVTGSDLSACEVTTARFVQWANLYAVFAPWDAFGAGDLLDPHFVFYIYGYTSGVAPINAIRTDLGLQIGDTVTRLQALYPAAVAYNGALGGRFYKVTAEGITGPSGTLEGSPETIRTFESGDWPCADTR